MLIYLVSAASLAFNFFFIVTTKKLNFCGVLHKNITTHTHIQTYPLIIIHKVKLMTASLMVVILIIAIEFPLRFVYVNR